MEIKPQKPLEDRFLRPQRMNRLSQLGISSSTLGKDNYGMLAHGNIGNISTTSLNELNSEQISNFTTFDKLIIADLAGRRSNHSIDWLPPSLQIDFFTRMQDLVGLLEAQKKNIPPLYDRSKWTKAEKMAATRSIILKAFPAIQALDHANDRPDKINRFFETYSTSSMEEYVDTVALPNAIAFWDWIRNQLPEDKKGQLELSNRVTDSTSLSDLLFIFGRKSDTIMSVNSDKQGVLFQDKEKWEAYMILNLTYLASIAELTQDPNEEKVLTIFHDSLCDQFPYTKTINGDTWELLFDRDPQTGMCTRSRLANDKDRAKLEAAGAKYGNIIPLEVRRFGTNENDIFKLNERKKGLFERMLKLWRDRPYPLHDLIGARCILPHPAQLPKFLNTLRLRLPDWSIEEEDPSPSNPQSTISLNKYKCTYGAFPDCPIELQVPFFSNSHNTSGNFWEIEEQPDTFPNAYKMKQIWELLVYFAPEELYRINWKDENLQAMLLKHANQALYTV